MSASRIARSELQLLQKLWEIGPSSVREVHESLPADSRPAYTTVQTMLYRLEQKGAVKRIKKVGTAHIFQAAYTKKNVYQKLINDLLDLLGGSAAPLMSHLVETGKLTLSDLQEAEKQLNEKQEHS